MATMLEMADVPAQHTHFARSLVPQLHGAPGDPTRAAFAEGGYEVTWARKLDLREDMQQMMWKAIERTIPGAQ